jgi:thioredoxin-like negative regulator of GroEL
MTDKSEISSKVEEIVSKYVESGKYDTALQAIDTLQAPEDKARIMSALANKFIEAGRYDTAFQFINDMQAPEDKARILTMIASKYIQLGQKNKASEILAQAFQIAQTIKGPESRVTVVTADYNNEGNVIRSTEVDDPYDRGSLLAEIAIKYAQAGQYNQALQVAEAIKDAANRNQLSRSLVCYQPS